MSDPALKNRPLLKVGLLLSIILGVFWVATLVPDLVILLIASILLAFLLRPLVKLLEFKLGLRRSLSIIAVFLLVGSALALVAIEGVPFLFRRIQGMYLQFRGEAG